MARDPLPATLAEIRNPESTESHIAALKALKHEIIGHEQRKELVINHGLIALLVRNITLEEGQTSGVRPPLGPWSQEDEVKVHSVQIISCLAHGGLAYVTPLVAAGAIKPLLALIQPAPTPPRLTREVLRAVLAIAEALAADILPSPEASGLGRLSNQLFARPTVEALASILRQPHAAVAVDDQIMLVLRILCICLRDARGVHQAALVKAGVLDFICCRLAALVYAEGYAAHTMDPAAANTMLPPPPRASLQYMLEALACLCYKSAYRSMRIIYSRHLLEVFPVAGQNQQHPDYQIYPDSTTPQPLNSNPIDSLLPRLQAVQSKGEQGHSRAFPPLGSLAMHSDDLGGIYGGPMAVSTRTITADEFGSPLIAWLIHIARNSVGLERLAALEFLAKLISALDQKIMDSWSESSRNRDRTLAFLVVPLLVRVIDATDPQKVPQKIGEQELAAIKLTRERAPLALAILVKECPALQKAAYEASAVQVLGKMLKKSFDPVSSSRKPMWNATPTGSAMDTRSDMEDPTCTLGPPAMAAENIHRFRCRAPALKGLAAIAQREDVYRRAIIELNLVTCLIDSLTPYPDGPIATMQSETSAAAAGKDGNPWFVLVAACKLTQTLSRSVGVLRTKLLDAGIAKPIFTLMSMKDTRVSWAGTDAVTNLLLHFSPMKEELLGHGIVGVLCAHAHSADSNLRSSALWALKHLCSASTRDVKLKILEELGTGWLIQVMSGELNGSSGARSHLSSGNAAGERVDLLNATDDTGMDVDDDADGESSSEDDDDDDERAYSNGSLRIPSIPAKYRTRLRAIRQEEESPTLKARRDDTRIQSQALDLVRNILTEAGPKQPDMIDHLFQALGTSRLFECLATKLEPKVTSPAGYAGKTTPSAAGSNYPNAPAGKRPTLTTPGGGTSSLSGSGSQSEREAITHRTRMDHFPTSIYGEEDLIISALFICIHIGNGRPQHRQMLLGWTTAIPASLNFNTLFASGGSGSHFPARILPMPTGPAQGNGGNQVMIKALDLVLPFFFHPDPRIRVACCWLIHNVLWLEDSSDTSSARGRAAELRERGFEECVRGAERGDPDLDVRERAKGCRDMFEKYLGVGPNYAGGEEVSGGRRGIGRSWER